MSLESSLEHQQALQRRGTSQRKNFSFSNDEVRRIERENQRLLHKLNHLLSDSSQKRAVRKSTSVAMNSPVSRLSHTALNRQREQQRIQRENQVSYGSLLKNVVNNFRNDALSHATQYTFFFKFCFCSFVYFTSCINVFFFFTFM